METINSNGNKTASQSISNISHNKTGTRFNDATNLSEFDMHLNTATNNPVQSDIYKFRKFV